MTTDDPRRRCVICGTVLLPAAVGRPRLYCSERCRCRARTLRNLRDELAGPERFEGRHAWVRARLAELETEHANWQVANR